MRFTPRKSSLPVPSTGKASTLTNWLRAGNEQIGQAARRELVQDAEECGIPQAYGGRRAARPFSRREDRSPQRLACLASAAWCKASSTLPWGTISPPILEKRDSRSVIVRNPSSSRDGDVAGDVPAIPHDLRGQDLHARDSRSSHSVLSRATCQMCRSAMAHNCQDRRSAPTHREAADRRCLGVRPVDSSRLRGSPGS